MSVRFLPSAFLAYQGALDRLHSLNPAAAYRFMDEIDRTCARLIEYPQSGHYIPEYPDRPHRQVIVQLLAGSGATWDDALEGRSWAGFFRD